MPTIDAEYFRKRAAAERELAGESADKYIAALHFELAGRYDKLADEEKPPVVVYITPRTDATTRTNAGS